MDGALGFTPAIGTDDDLSLARVPIGQRFQNPQGHPAGRHFIHLRALKNSQGTLPTLPPPSRLSDPISPEGSDHPPNHQGLDHPKPPSLVRTRARPRDATLPEGLHTTK